MDAIIHDWKFYFPIGEKIGILLNEENVLYIEKFQLKVNSNIVNEI